jgi:hypothetical protein
MKLRNLPLRVQAAKDWILPRQFHTMLHGFAGEGRKGFMFDLPSQASTLGHHQLHRPGIT